MVKVALAGGAYTAHSVIASAQRCVNLVQEPIPENQGEPMPSAAYPTPGTTLLGTIGTGPIRGIRQCTTGGVYVVSGDTLYSVDVSNWTGAPLGTLTVGIKTPVSMQDNGLDMLVVDGTTNGWQVTLADSTFVQIPSTTTQAPYIGSDVGSIGAGAARYTPVDAAGAGAITTATVTLGGGYTGNLKCSVFASAGAGPTTALGSANVVANPVTGANTLTFSTPIPVTKGTRYWLGFDSDTSHGTWSLAGAATGLASTTPYTAFPAAAPTIVLAQAVVVSLTISNDPGSMFAGADRVDYLDTYFLLNKPNTPQFYISGSLAVSFDPLDFANKEAYSDLLVTVVIAKRLVYLFGERTTEIWYDAGATDIGAGSFPFAAMQSEVFIDHGCAAKYSPAIYDNSVFWLTRDRQGQGIVIMVAGYQTKRVSTYAIEAEIAGYERISDAIGFCYQLAGHSFYVLTFPQADKTWSYDISTERWHEWLWIDTNGAEHRHRANCFWPVNDLGVIGDWQNGNLYALDQKAFTDNGQPIKRVRSFPHMLADGKRVFYRQFLADIETGWAPEAGAGIPAPPPSTYNLRPIILNNTTSGVTNSSGASGFPSTPFNYLLFSKWVCLGTQPRAVGIFHPISFMSVQTNQSSVHIRLLKGTSLPVFDGTYTAPISNILSNVLISVDLTTQRIQVYLNDVPLTLASGGWTDSGQFHVTTNGWNVTGSGSVAPGPGLADLFIAAPAAFFDLTVVANRRKFIRADLLPADLGTNASSVLGTPPPIYLTVRPAGVPNDFAANSGTGGAFTITVPPLAFQAAGTCVVAPAPISVVSLVDLNLISLRWSDDRGHSWGSPVTQDIGAAGEYRTSLQWQRLAYARDRCFELSWSVPMRTALQGAWIDVTPAQS